MKKQALITGATSGIGKATALRLAADGWDILATGRRRERLDALQEEIETAGGQCRTLAFDLRDEQACHDALDAIDRVDLLVNNAGLAAGFEHIDRGATSDWNTMIDTNIKGLLYVTQIIARKMIAAGGGHIVNIGSIAGTEPYENGAVYCATKQRNPSRHGRNRILHRALSRRPHGRGQCLSGRGAPHGRRHCRSNCMDHTITGPYER